MTKLEGTINVLKCIHGVYNVTKFCRSDKIYSYVWAGKAITTLAYQTNEILPMYVAWGIHSILDSKICCIATYVRSCAIVIHGNGKGNGNSHPYIILYH